MKVAVFAGPTGGHFYPALAFCEALKKRRPEAHLLFVTGERGRFLAEKAHSERVAEFEFLPDFPFPRPTSLEFLVRIFSFLVKLVQGYLKTGTILGNFRPHLSIGFGSYVAFPGLWVSHRKGIPTLIHEQNRKMGRANQKLLTRVDRVALSFEPDVPYRVSCSVTGLPIRAALVEGARQVKRFDHPADARKRLQILILGGSQGSSSLNRLWSGVISSLKDEEKSKIAVIHITGEREYSGVRQMYFSNSVEASVFPYYEKMEELYSKADLAVTRAGAGTLFELALFRLPAIVFPFPHADGHQEANARHFEKEGAILLLLEKDTDSAKLKRVVFELIRSETRRKILSENLSRLARPDASDRLVNESEELLASKEACLA